MADTWREVAEHREQALMKRSTKNQENLSTKVKEHSPLAVGEHVMIQNQVGNSPTRWNKQGVVVEVLPNDSTGSWGMEQEVHPPQPTVSMQVHPSS